jgi:hypothetical protein
MAVPMMRAALVTVITVTFGLMPGTAAFAATITVNSLADTGAPGICVLRDAITAANTKTATNGCVAGTGSDTINFSVAGTITLASTLPQITDPSLTINGPASPGITISGDNRVEVMTIATGGKVAVNNVTISDGLTTSRLHGGGGIDNNGLLTVNKSTFSGNKSSYIVAGAIFNNAGATLTVTDGTFANNENAVANTGGTPGGTVIIISSTFSRNTDSAVYNDGEMTLTNSTFSGNIAGGGAGGGVLNLKLLNVTNCTFSNNNGGSYGGGIANGGVLTITNSTFSDNSVTSIGVGGGAIYSDGGGSSASVKGSILAANGVDNCLGTLTDAGYNISDDASCGFAKTGSANNGDLVNPLLSTAGLADNGGPTETIALQDGSPAIDAIPLAHCTDQAAPPNPIITDQRLFRRPDPGEANCDIGAYEFQDFPLIPFSTFGGGLKIDPDAGIFVLGGRFVLGTGGTIDPASQPVAFAVGNDAIRLPPGSFVPDSVGYVYQKTINGIARYIHIKFTSAPGIYQLVALRKGGTLTTTTSPVPVTLTIGDNSGGTQMNTTFF